MRTFQISVTSGLAGAFLVGATWTALGLENAPQVAMAPIQLKAGSPSAALALPARMAAGAPAWGRISVANVNIRWGPGSQHGIITVFHGGDYVRVLSSVEGWHRVEWPLCAPAWIASDLVQVDGRVTGNRVRIRAGGTTAAPILCEMNKNDRVEILDTVGNWYKIKPPVNASAYVSAKCVLLGVEPPVPAAEQGRSASNSDASRETDSVRTEKGNPEIVPSKQLELVSDEVSLVQSPIVQPADRTMDVGSTPLPPVLEVPIAQRVDTPADNEPQKSAEPKGDSVEPVKVMAPMILPSPVASAVPVATPAKPERVNRAPSIDSVQAGHVEEPPSIVAPVPSPVEEPISVPAPSTDSLPVLDDDLEDEDPDLQVQTPDQAGVKSARAHDMLQALVERVPTAALVKPSPDQPHLVVVSVEVRAAADQDEFGALLPPPRFVRDRAESREISNGSGTSGLQTGPSGLRASTPLVFRLPSEVDASAEFVFLNGTLQEAEMGAQGARHKLLAGEKIFLVRADASIVNLDAYKDRQVELLARCSSGGDELIVSALHPLD
jgi:uncharacterized protein YraI